MIVRDWLKIGAPTLHSIISEVSRETGYSVAELRKPMDASREPRAVAHARHYAMWRMRRETRHSLPAIGRFLGGRHHATVLHGVRMHEKRAAEAANWMLAA